MQSEMRVVNLDTMERWVSLVVGAAVMIYGLRRLPLGALALLVSGGYLLYRSVSGRCLIYQQMGIDRSRRGATGFETEAQHRAGRPRDVVQEASEESFPASDAPAWTSGT